MLRYTVTRKLVEVVVRRSSQRALCGFVLATFVDGLVGDRSNLSPFFLSTT